MGHMIWAKYANKASMVTEVYQISSSFCVNFAIANSFHAHEKPCMICRFLIDIQNILILMRIEIHRPC